MKGGWAIRLTDRFVKDFKSLPIDLQKQVEACIKDLGVDPIPNTRRAHRISIAGHRPQVFSVDVSSNKSHKLSFEIDGNTAVLRRVGTHRELDRSN